jgi:hypothetical protein
MNVEQCDPLTRRVPNSGSFIRPSTSICYGYSFLRALSSKYIELPHGTATQERFFLRSSSSGAIEVEAVGLDKIRGKLANLQRLRDISLDGENVADCDPTGEILRVCPSKRFRIHRLAVLFLHTSKTCGVWTCPGISFLAGTLSPSWHRNFLSWRD